MNRLLQVLILATLTTISCQSLAESEVLWDTRPYVWFAQTATSAGRVRVTITKTKIRLARVQKPVAKLFLNDDDTDYYDELPELQVGYRRPELIDQSADIELSDSIKLRLALARYKALDKYNEVWGNGNIA